MTSIFERALGADFSRLHPRLQQRFRMSSQSGTAQLGHGVMTSMSRGALAALPVWALGSARRMELPGNGTDVAFDLANYAYRDSFGRDTFAYSRRFHLGARRRRFDDTMIFSEHRGAIVNYLGSHQDIAAELHLSTTATGGMRMVGGDQRLYLGPIRLQLPSVLAAKAEVIETFDDEQDRFTISVDINSATGRLFGYRGWFVMNEVPFQRVDIPAGVLPDKERERD